MSNKIVYRREKGSQLTSSEVDGNFKYLDEKINKLSDSDYFIHDAGYFKSGNNIVVNAGSEWKINGDVLSNPVNYEFIISPTISNKRLDVIVATDLGEFKVIQGVEGEFYSKPILDNSLPYLFIYVDAEGINNLGSDAEGDYVSKLSYSWREVNMDRLLSVSDSNRNIDVIGGNSFVEGVKNGLFGFEVDKLADGYEVSIRNNRSDYITIIHNSNAGIPIFLYTLENYYLRPLEVIVLKYISSNNCFVVSGALDIRLSADNVDDIIGYDSNNMFIDSAKGFLLTADDLNTTLTPTIQRYWKDITYKAVAWQWFRTSGTTQEDQDSDAIWSIDKKQRILNLTAEDFTNNIYERSITFTCQAIVEGEIITQTLKFN